LHGCAAWTCAAASPSKAADRKIRSATNAPRWEQLPAIPRISSAFRETYCYTPSAKIFVRVYGTGNPVLLLHGGLGHGDLWAHQINWLEGKGFSAVVPDLRGHGRSPFENQKLSYRAYADDIAEVLRFLKIETISIVGWSDGAIAALVLGLESPDVVERLLLFGVNTLPSGLIPGGSRKPCYASYVERCASDYRRLSQKPEQWKRFNAALRSMWASEPRLLDAKVSSLKRQVTIAQASHDEIIKGAHARHLASVIPGARFEGLEGVSHFAPLQDPEAFCQVMDRFLA
jgi:pimeloyl-ACP methyl ester carboxylesterase